MPHEFISCDALLSSLEESFSTDHLSPAAAVSWSGDAKGLAIRTVEVRISVLFVSVLLPLCLLCLCVSLLLLLSFSTTAVSVYLQPLSLRCLLSAVSLSLSGALRRGQGRGYISAAPNLSPCFETPN